MKRCASLFALTITFVTSAYAAPRSTPTATPDATFGRGGQPKNDPYFLYSDGIVEWMPQSSMWRVGAHQGGRGRIKAMADEAATLSRSKVGAAYEKQVIPLLTNGIAQAAADATAHAAVVEPFDIVYIITSDGGVTAAVPSFGFHRKVVENAHIPARVPPPPHAPWLVATHIRKK